ncbi:MAG: ribosomal protein S18-alanine N-acetyltransferase [Clostridiales bacterium]|nr:ribosomal protein S18-alanine N-acetyltransferase [Clostridiales bacterium]
MNIRPVREEDVKDLMRLEDGSIEHPWEEEELAKLAQDPNKSGFAAEEGGRVTGYIGFSYILDEAEIGNVVVDKEYRRRGIGEALIEAAKGYLREQGIARVYLEVAEDNDAAKNLYSKAGFTSFNIRKDYYGKGRNAILMVCEI